MLAKNNLEWKNSSTYVIGLLHNLYLTDKYKLNNEYEFDGVYYIHNINPTYRNLRNGEVSAKIAETIISLTEEERLCIIHSMENGEGWEDAVREYPNILWVQHAVRLAKIK